MTRSRLYGSDVPFCEWMRNCDNLPAFSMKCGFVVTDIDVLIHRYLMEIDGIGSRDIQAILHIEVKTRGGEPNASQRDTLWKQLCFNGVRIINGDYVRHFGVSVLKLSHTTPVDSEYMEWGRFNRDGILHYRVITITTLIRLFRFELHPDNFQPRPFRRHHKNHIITTMIAEPLRFESEAIVAQRS